MKRIAAISFFLILVFNLYGYQLLFSYLQNQQAVAIEKQVDNQRYNEADLVSVKTTLNLPYYNSSAEFERVYGSINIGGTEYEYVKRRVYNDTLELLCLPNEGKAKLQSAKNLLAKTSANETSSIPGKKLPSVLKPVLPTFFQPFSQQLLGFSNSYLHLYPRLAYPPVFSGYASAKDKPPQLLALLS